MPEYPALHLHADIDMLPALSEEELAGHNSHVPDPLFSLNVPGAHEAHALELLSSLNVPGAHATQLSFATPRNPWSGPSNPASQVHPVGLPEAKGEDECGGQTIHVDSEIAANAVEYLPLEHGIHPELFTC